MIKVAIAEDHELLRASYVSLINGNEQFDLIVQAKHGKELLAKLNPEALPDVVLVDLDMPIMDGPETVLELRKKFGEDLKILALSVHEEYFLIKRMLENGTNGYVSKGVGVNELLLAITKVNTVGYYLSSGIQKVVHKNNSKNAIKLSKTESDIISLIFKEYTTTQIAEKLTIPKSTIATYRTRILEKVGVKNTVGMILFAIRTGICTLPPNNE